MTSEPLDRTLAETHRPRNPVGMSLSVVLWSLLVCGGLDGDREDWGSIMICGQLYCVNWVTGRVQDTWFERVIYLHIFLFLWLVRQHLTHTLRFTHTHGHLHTCAFLQHIILCYFDILDPLHLVEHEVRRVLMDLDHMVFPLFSGSELRTTPLH